MATANPTSEINETENTLEHVPFEDGYSINVFPSLNKVIYIFKDMNGYEAAKYKHVEPLMITELSQVGKEIKKHLDPHGDLSARKLGELFENIKMALNELYQLHQIIEDRESEESRLQGEQELQSNMEIAKSLLESKEMPILYIASLVSWLTAGERVNIMLAFIAYASQVILQNPINVVGLGEGGSGKTHIENTALNLLPGEYVLNEKKTTEAALFRRAEIKPDFYDGKIVNYGDLGGRNSQDFILEVKDLLKELQSDGYLCKPLVVPGEDGGFEVKELELYGRPSTTYTTIPGFEFDDQEMSRSIFITPRMDNKAVFHAHKKMLELDDGKTYKKYKEYLQDSEIVPFIVLLLRKRMKNIKIINPYTESVIDFLGESEYFKRDFDKYNGILKTITAINGYNRPLFEYEGQDILFTSLNDIQLFISLLRNYHESIAVNISPKAAEVLDEIRANIDDWIYKQKVPEMGFTTSNFYELSTINLSKRSIQTYFGELNKVGFLKVVDKMGNANIYNLSGRVSDDLLDNFLVMSDEHKNLIIYEYGSVALNFILEDEPHEKLSILWYDPDVTVPRWEDYDR